MATLKGGEKAGAYLAALGKRIASGKVVKVGFLEGSTGTDGGSIPLRAALNNFGTSRIPARPFMSNAIAEHSDEWGPDLAILLEANGNNGDLALDTIGEVIVGQIREAINVLDSPPLAQSTIDRKGSEKPLIETSDMWNAVAAQVTTP